MDSIWSEWFGIRYPLICAPMGGVAGGRLATAVTRAGALGMVGMGSSGSTAALERELTLVEPGTTFGIGMVDWVMRKDADLLGTAIEAKPALLSVSFGDDFDWIERAHGAGIRTVTQADDVESARRANAAGVDLLVARGLEGGGHGRPTHELRNLLSDVVAASDAPVLAAGAISSAADVRRSLDAGAVGVWVGTAFAACPESLLGDTEKAALRASSETEVTTRYDEQAGYAWPSDIPERVLAGRSTSINAGIGVAHLTEERSVDTVVRSLVESAS